MRRSHCDERYQVLRCSSAHSGDLTNQLSPLSVSGGSPSADIKRHSQLRLEKELKRMTEELKLKDDEVEKLSRVRDQVVEELDELTSSLFQEAYDMVNTAKAQQAAAEKKMHESVGKVEILQAEVSALKQMIRATQSSQSTTLTQNEKLRVDGKNDVNAEYFQEFREWLERPSLSRENGFLASCYRDDVLPCIRFKNKDFADNILAAIEQNKLCMEAVAPHVSCPNYCTLSGPSSKPCKFQVKLDDGNTWHFISSRARNKVAAVCNFYSYLRYITQGIVKTDVHSMFKEVIRLQAEMALCRLGVVAKY
ncbi:rab-3A-interacting protein-like [Corticium candelabrum]|uniref:rab-3A-interacting protein-like n=1 Tax=Corticium candelabrum TaxID=121492 RepID=UPI002E25A9C9|nr:rab-3A-interacting protein-like [Corticium candelabrum]